MHQQPQFRGQKQDHSVDEPCDWCGNEANSEQGLVYNYENEAAFHNDCAAAATRARYR